jgi:hypothetical protein
MEVGNQSYVTAILPMGKSPGIHRSSGEVGPKDILKEREDDRFLTVLFFLVCEFVFS